MPEQKQNKPKIISVSTLPQNYELFTQGPRASVVWDIPSGSWVGIWSFDLLNLLPNEILKLTDEFTFEVWHPDLRADKIYSHTFQNGLTCKLFPAARKKKLHGLKFLRQIYSPCLYRELEKEVASNNVIVQANTSLLGFNKFIFKKISAPIIFTYHSEISLPSIDISRPTRNLLSKINIMLENLWLKKNINKISALTYQNDAYLDKLKAIYQGHLYKVTMGCDFSFWRKLDKSECRKSLNLPAEKLIFISASRIAEVKQLDRLIEVLMNMDSKYDFLYIIAGTGLEYYLKYFMQKAQPLVKKGKILFAGYRREESLLRYLNAADLFISTSSSEGGPVSIMEAFACELPVFSTKTGNTAELMEEHNAGCLVGTKNYKEWEEKLSQILETRQLPKILDRNIAKEHYDWPIIADKFINIYREALEMNK